MNRYKIEDWCKLTTPKPTNGLAYYVSNEGRIKSVDEESGRERFLKGSTSSGNLALTIRVKGGGNQTLYINREVAKLWVRQPSKAHKFVICIDGDKSNCDVDNLKWVTQKELTDFQMKQGVFRNRDKKNLKLNETKAELIRQRAGKVKNSIQAKQHGVSIRTIERVIDGTRWA